MVDATFFTLVEVFFFHFGDGMLVRRLAQQLGVWLAPYPSFLADPQGNNVSIGDELIN